MARLRFYKELKSWDSLDKFYNEEINGINFENSENFARTFCRCGKVFGEIRKTCSCGRTDFKEIKNNCYGHSYNKLLKRIENSNYIINVERLVLEIHERETLDFSVTNGEALHLKNLRIINYDKTLIQYISENDIKDYKHYSELKDFFPLKSNRYSLDGSSLVELLMFINSYPNLYEDNMIWQYKNLFKRLVKSLRVEEGKVNKIDFMDLLQKHDIDDMKNLNILNSYASEGNYVNDYKLFKTEEHYRFSSVKETLSDKLKELDNKYKDKESLWVFIRHYLNNGTISVSNGIRLIDFLEQLKGPASTFNENNYMWERMRKEEILKKFDMDWLKYFNFYIKENIFSVDSSRNFLLNFIKDAIALNELGIEVNENNLKQKNINVSLSRSHLLKETNIPEEKVDLFYKHFEESPIKALQLLKDRRQITKKQKEEFSTKD